MCIKHFSCILKYDDCLEGKDFLYLSCELYCLVFFFHETPFFLKEQLAWIMGRYFLTNEESMHVT